MLCNDENQPFEMVYRKIAMNINSVSDLALHLSGTQAE